jgi:hypothetical protein
MRHAARREQARQLSSHQPAAAEEKDRFLGHGSGKYTEAPGTRW